MTTPDMPHSRYYSLGSGWVHESTDGNDTIRRTWTADPRVDRDARLDSSVRLFPDGSWQTTWYDNDGRATVDSVES